jgi:hypothetical protein
MAERIGAVQVMVADMEISPAHRIVLRMRPGVAPMAATLQKMRIVDQNVGNGNTLCHASESWFGYRSSPKHITAADGLSY